MAQSVLKRIQMGCSDIQAEDYVRVNDVLLSGQISPGKYCTMFEQGFADLVGRTHALFVNSGTDALRIALLAMKEKYLWDDGDRVIVPALTFPATLNVILQAGLTPYIIDVGMHDYCLNPDRVKHVLECETDDIVAMIPVHLFGQLADMPKLMALAEKYHLAVLEDSCETIGGGAGAAGDAAAFSTYQCHHIQTGVGGVAVTDDGELHELMRSFANHGRNTFYLPGYRTPPVCKALLNRRFRFDRPGYSSRATELQAALGIGQIERFSNNLSKRIKIADALTANLFEFAQLNLPFKMRYHSFMMYPIVIAEGCDIQKMDLLLALEEEGIETRDMMPITNQQVFKPYTSGVYPVAERINRDGFYIPVHPKMTLSDVNRIVDVFRKALTAK